MTEQEKTKLGKYTVLGAMPRDLQDVAIERLALFIALVGEGHSLIVPEKMFNDFCMAEVEAVVSLIEDEETNERFVALTVLDIKESTNFPPVFDDKEKSKILQ